MELDVGLGLGVVLEQMSGLELRLERLWELEWKRNGGVGLRLGREGGGGECEGVDRKRSRGGSQR